MGKVVALVQSKALDLAKGAAPEQFMPLMREEVRRQLAEGFAGVEVVAGTKLAQLREEAEFGATLFLTAEKVKTGPVLREGLDDAFWVKASREGGFKEYKTHGAVTTRTEFAACHDGKDLYIGVWCHQPRAETEAKTAKLGNENRNGVELFINRTVPGSVKWQLLFNAAGGVKGYSDETAAICPWVCPDLTSAVRVGDDAWTLVARIPFASLGIDPAVDKTIGLQVVRNKSVPENDGKLEISTWYPSSIMGHRGAGRGLLVLE